MHHYLHYTEKALIESIRHFFAISEQFADNFVNSRCLNKEKGKVDASSDPLNIVDIELLMLSIAVQIGEHHSTKVMPQCHTTDLNLTSEISSPWGKMTSMTEQPVGEPV